MRSILQFSKYFTGRLGRSESLYIGRKGSLKVHTFKIIFRRATRGEILLNFFPRASRGAAWPLHFKFVSHAYALAVSPQNGLKRSEILRGHVPTCHTPLRAHFVRFMRSVTCTLEPPFSKS